MSDTQFTQGEWWYDGYCYIFAKQPDGNTYPMIADFDTDEAYLARMRGVGAGLVENGQQDANARLIAAAPDLLAALKLALPRLTHKHECGSVRPTEEWAAYGSVSFDNCSCVKGIVRAAILKATEGTK